MNVYEYLNNVIAEKGAAYLILIDPDKTSGKKLERFVQHCERSGVDGFLVGGSLLISNNLDSIVTTIKKTTSLPAILFPGSVDQLTPLADAVLFISLISGRNAEHIIGKHILAAPIIKSIDLEPISTGYMLIESGKTTTAEYMSGSAPLPRNKPEIAAATALAAEYLGMKLIYLEAGSGAEKTVPDEMIKLVASSTPLPVIVGGGIRESNIARNKVKDGAKIIVTGNFFEAENNWKLIKEFADAVHINNPLEV